MAPKVKISAHIDVPLKEKAKEIVLELLLKERPELPKGTVVKWIREDRKR